VEHLDIVRSWVDAASRIVALTGAGISTESGIPDFRGPQGVWTKNPKAERLSNIHSYMADASVRKEAWQGRLNHPAWRAGPNAGHLALVDLERRGKLHALITQNIDGLHQLAGSSPDKVIEVHGTMREVMCMACGWRGPMLPVLDRIRAGDEDPPCRPAAGNRDEPAGLPGGRRRARRPGSRRSRGDRQRRANAVRRDGRCRAAETDR
jgi:NAD-dependent deacetylase